MTLRKGVWNFVNDMRLEDTFAVIDLRRGKVVRALEEEDAESDATLRREVLSG